MVSSNANPEVQRLKRTDSVIQEETDIRGSKVAEKIIKKTKSVKNNK